MSETTADPKDQYILVGPDGRPRASARRSERSIWITLLQGTSHDDSELSRRIERAKSRGYRVEKLNG